MLSVNESSTTSTRRIVDFKVDNSPPDIPSNYSNAIPQDLEFETLFNFDFEGQRDVLISKNQVKKAGRKIRKNEGDLKDARSKIQLFRAEHKKPLEYIVRIVSRYSSEDTQVVARLKRLDTIIDKLTRPSLDGINENKTCVTNMNDIGGCRAIFESIECLYTALGHIKIIVDRLPNIKIKDIDNYIEKPKGNDCGYRSLHVIFEFETLNKTLKIEAQLRTRAQHLWATTVEVIDLIERVKIKTLSHRPNSEKNRNQVHWEELLSLMSEVISGNEGCRKLTDTRRVEIKNKLKYLNNKVKAINKLRSFKLVSEKINSKINYKNSYYIVVIGLEKGSIKVIAEQAYDNEHKAMLIYNNIEQVVSSMDNTNTLMVATKDISSLGDAYPNYLGDCQAFIEILHEAMV
ncbi:hypothetical protein EXT42_01585 [Pseudoalteromonas sp. CO302Y]|nr:hypothetical protein EXT42_01585 [Pseudoalteromonas sp. CO302Y]RZG11089.1 hypothetical protein EXT40_01585 [Pseudoalteromonas sp. CO133X]